METKVCKRCEMDKPVSDFNTRSDGGRYTQCKECYAIDMKERAMKRPKLSDDAVRTCRTCNTEKPILEFPTNGNSQGGYLPHCKRCYTIKNAYAKWGIENIFDYVDGRSCEICSKTVSMGRHNFAIDHDHRCCGPSKACANCLRGILCNDCNHGIGKLGDSVARLESAIAYLKKYGTVY